MVLLNFRQQVFTYWIATEVQYARLLYSAYLLFFDCDIVRKFQAKPQAILPCLTLQVSNQDQPEVSGFWLNYTSTKPSTLNSAMKQYHCGEQYWNYSRSVFALRWNCLKIRVHIIVGNRTWWYFLPYVRRDCIAVCQGQFYVSLNTLDNSWLASRAMIDLPVSFISCILLFQASWRLYVISHFQKRWILVLYGGRETSEMNKVYPECCTR